MTAGAAANARWAAICAGHPVAVTMRLGCPAVSPDEPDVEVVLRACEQMEAALAIFASDNAEMIAQIGEVGTAAYLDAQEK